MMMMIMMMMMMMMIIVIAFYTFCPDFDGGGKSIKGAGVGVGTGGERCRLAGTAVAVQSRGPGITHHEVIYLQLGTAGQARLMHMRVAVCLHMQTMQA